MSALRAAAKPLPPFLRRAARRPLVRYRHVGLRPADALLVSYPKSGSTWLRFLLAHAITSREADFDSIREIVPPIGRHREVPSLLPSGGRLVRSHEPLRPYRGRPGQPVVSLVRDGRDVALSYLAHERRYGRATGDVVAFLDRFLRGDIDSYGAWHEHVLAAIDFETANPVLRVRYEDLRADPVTQLARILDFLGVDAHRAGSPSLLQVVEANSKENMRAKESGSTFLATMANDGSPFVRPDRREGWTEVVPSHAQARFLAVCGPALRAAGYET